MRHFLMLSLFVSACATATIANTDVPDTEVNRSIVAVVERYRTAMEARDGQSLRELASRHYYENASSTWTTDDDWGRTDLDKVLKRYQDHVKAVTYKLTIKDLRVFGNRADVDCEHTWAFQYTDGKRDAWTKKTDTNRLELIQEDGSWRFLSGM